MLKFYIAKFIELCPINNKTSYDIIATLQALSTLKYDMSSLFLMVVMEGPTYNHHLLAN